jgi:hypothetical protein
MKYTGTKKKAEELVTIFGKELAIDCINEIKKETVRVAFWDDVKDEVSLL